MYRFFLDANPDGLKELTTVSEKLSTGFTVMALGVATVFAVLAILMIVLYLFRVIFYHEKKPAPKTAPAPEPKHIEAPEPAPQAQPEEVKTDDGALIAAITAAIAAYTSGDEAFASGFRVVSFRRAEHASPWNKSK